jgi:hypothetical protein
MLPPQVLDLDARGKAAGTPNLKAVIVNCHTHGSASLGVVPVTERIDQRFAQRDRREKRLIHALE